MPRFRKRARSVVRASRTAVSLAEASVLRSAARHGGVCWRRDGGDGALLRGVQRSKVFTRLFDLFSAVRDRLAQLGLTSLKSLQFSPLDTQQGEEGGEV